MIYLDHNATTPIAPEVLEAMTEHLSGRTKFVTLIPDKQKTS
jgi:cysteine sulfinate desulfinase/cysteine desulfurase-like protein